MGDAARRLWVDFPCALEVQSMRPNSVKWAYVRLAYQSWLIFRKRIAAACMPPGPGIAPGSQPVRQETNR